MLDRRGFLKFVGGAAVGTLATPVVWKGLDDISIWTQNWSWIPSLEYGNHDNTYVRTVSKLCPSAVGTRIRLVGGRPVRVLGDPDNPLSLGGISALAATEVQMRYSPARLKRPLRRAPDGAFKEISWEEAENLLLDQLKQTRTSGGTNGLLCVSGDENGSMNELFSAFTTRMNSDRFFIMPGDAQATARAWKLMGGTGRVGYDFANSDFVLAIGANVLETWGTVVCNRRAWGDARPAGDKPTMQLAFAGPVQNNTAAGADMWLPIKPGTEYCLLLGVIHQLMKEGRPCPAGHPECLTKIAGAWTPEKVVAATGIPAAQFTALLDALKNAEAPLVIVGSDMDQGGGTAPVMLGLSLNVMLGRLNKKGGMIAVPTGKPVVARAKDYESMLWPDLVAHAEGVAAGKTPGSKMLMFYEANPVYALPGKGIEALFKKAAFSVSFSSFLDETAMHCDLVLPAALGLERYDDVAYPFGYPSAIYALVQPAVEPLYEARPAGEVLIQTAAAMGMDLGFEDVVAMLQAKAEAVGADWVELSNGNPSVKDLCLPVTLNCTALGGKLGDALLKAPAALEKGQLDVGFVHKLSLGTAETAIPPFNTKTITPDELTRNVLVARVNSATLKKIGLYEGNLVTLASKTGTVTARLKVFEGVTSDTVALTLGFGHTAFETFNGGKGMNVMTLVSVVEEPGTTGFAMWNSARVNVAKA